MAAHQEGQTSLGASTAGTPQPIRAGIEVFSLYANQLLNYEGTTLKELPSRKFSPGTSLVAPQPLPAFIEPTGRQFNRSKESNPARFDFFWIGIAVAIHLLIAPYSRSPKRSDPRRQVSYIGLKSDSPPKGQTPLGIGP